MSANGSGRLAGKVAFVTGVARGQGRCHAVRLAEEGADIVGLDICGPVETVPVPPATEDDLAGTVEMVEALDRRMIARVADVRDQAAVDSVVAAGLPEFGHIDIVAANAGTCSFGRVWELSEAEWQTMLDVNLTGAFHTAKALVPQMIEAGDGGSMVFMASIAGIRPMIGIGHYVAAKHGVVGLMKNLAIELGPYGIRANAILPGNTRTQLADSMIDLIFKPALQQSLGDEWEAQLEPTLAGLNPQQTAFVQPKDQANALLWLASDASRFVTGQAISVDAGWGMWLK